MKSKYIVYQEGEPKVVEIENEEETICGKPHNNGDKELCGECIAIKHNL